MRFYIRFLFFILAAIIGGNLNFEIARIFLIILLLFIAVEVIYKIDKYYTQKQIKNKKL